MSMRAVASARAALQHGNAAMKLPDALDALGVPYPPDWSFAWDQVKASVIEALVDLRDEVRTLT